MNPKEKELVTELTEIVVKALDRNIPLVCLEHVSCDWSKQEFENYFTWLATATRRQIRRFARQLKAQMQTNEQESQWS